jgi:hypothetical protein
MPDQQDEEMRQLAQQQIDWEVWRERAARERLGYEKQADLTTALIRGTIDFAAIFIRSTLLANGGAVVVLLALLGSIWASSGAQGSASALLLSGAIKWFVYGMTSGLLTAGFAYLAQAVISDSSDRTRFADIAFGILRAIAVLLGLISVASFAIGAFEAVAVFQGAAAT